jgi:hypothetical protein
MQVSAEIEKKALKVRTFASIVVNLDTGIRYSGRLTAQNLKAKENASNVATQDTSEETVKLHDLDLDLGAPRWKGNSLMKSILNVVLGNMKLRRIAKVLNI